MIRNLTSRLAFSMACLVLSSCATLKELASEETSPLVEPAGWQAEQKIRQKIKIWEIRGRLGVQTKTNGGSMDIIWKQSGKEFSIRLIAPLGAGTYLIQGDNSYAVIRYPDGNKKTVNDIDKVFVSTLGVDLPVTAIKDWVRGLPAKVMSIDAISWNAKHRLHRLKQSGWNVELTKYTGTKSLMPHAIYLSRDDNDDLDIRLVLRQWLVDN